MIHKNWKRWLVIALIGVLMCSVALADGRVVIRKISEEHSDAEPLEIGVYYYVDQDAISSKYSKIEGWFKFVSQEAGTYFFTCERSMGDEETYSGIRMQVQSSYKELLAELTSADYYGDPKGKPTIVSCELNANETYYIKYVAYCGGQISICAPNKHVAESNTYTAKDDICICGESFVKTVSKPTEKPIPVSKPAKEIKPIKMAFSDDIAIRILADGSIEATVEEYDEADWDRFKEEGHSWAVQYTDEEYRAKIDSYASMESFREMQAKGKYISVSANCYGTLAGVTEDGKLAINSRSQRRYWVDAEDKMWTGLTDVALGSYTVVALKQNGTVAWHDTNNMFVNGMHPEKWKDIAQIANDMIAVGLRKDGTVCYSAPNREPWYPDEYIPLNTIDSWTDIVQVDTAWESVVGLRADGTVVSAGDSHMGKIDTSGWTNIKKVAVGMNHVVGLKDDGTLISTVPDSIVNTNGGGSGAELQGVVDVYANRNYTLAILENGDAVLLGDGINDGGGVDGAWAAGEWKF